MYFWGLVLIVISLPFSKFMMSVAHFFLSGILILEFMKMERFEQLKRRHPGARFFLLIIPVGLIWVFKSFYLICLRFFRRDNLPAIAFFSIYLLHVLGLLLTVDFDYALKDLRIKLPIFALPIILSVSRPLEWKQFRTLMLFFAGAVIVGTFISTYILISHDIDNMRDISTFISHIRFSLLICIAIFALGYFAIRETSMPGWARLILIAANVWLLLYLVISASMTGFVVLSLAAFVLAIVYAFRKRNTYSRIAVVGMLLVPVIMLLFLTGIVSDVYKVQRVDFSRLDSHTARGVPYWHDTTNLQTENGHYVWIYLATDEMREAWNKRSEIDFEGKDNKGQMLKFTLIRYLTSKGYRKDAEGVEKLSSEDIAYIEDGEASVHYHERSEFYIRLYKIIWETQQYFRTGDPSGHSAMQRIEYWKTSILIIKDHPLLGVGTGDMNIAFERQYEIMNSPLKPEFRWRSHNQFLSIAVGFGLLGLIWFLFALFYPPIRMGRMSDYFYLSFFVIMIVSMLSEDTIETQAGATIFAFFTSLFLFGKKDKTFI
jgi:hypothetical protein